jgi:hypothetical protein
MENRGSLAYARMHTLLGRESKSTLFFDVQTPHSFHAENEKMFIDVF